MASNTPSQPLSPPSKPVLVFDGGCALCAAWVDSVRRRKGQELECVAYQEASVTVRFPGLVREQLEHSVHLIAADGRIHRGAQAVLRTPGGGGAQALLLWLCERLPGIAHCAESVYRVVAKNRRLLGILFSRRSARRQPQQAAKLG